jgi:hypothetical protein
MVAFPDPTVDSSMIGISFTGITAVLGVLAIGLLAIVSTRCADKSKRSVKKADKAEIMKQLLALSERESSLVATVPSARLKNAHRKTAPNSRLPIRSKTR